MRSASADGSATVVVEHNKPSTRAASRSEGSPVVPRNDERQKHSRHNGVAVNFRAQHSKQKKGGAAQHPNYWHTFGVRHFKRDHNVSKLLLSLGARQRTLKTNFFHRFLQILIILISPL